MIRVVDAEMRASIGTAVHCGDYGGCCCCSNGDGGWEDSFLRTRQPGRRALAV